MNKEQLTTILQACLFAQDGLTTEEILMLYEYNPELVKIGVNLQKYLNQQIKSQEAQK